MCSLSKSRRDFMFERTQENVPMEGVHVSELSTRRRKTTNHGCPGEKLCTVDCSTGTYNFRIYFESKVALRRQQSSEAMIASKSIANSVNDRTISIETLLAQKKIYQKHLRHLQQSKMSQSVFRGKSKNYLNNLNHFSFHFAKSINFKFNDCLIQMFASAQNTVYGAMLFCEICFRSIFVYPIIERETKKSKKNSKQIN